MPTRKSVAPRPVQFSPFKSYAAGTAPSLGQRIAPFPGPCVRGSLGPPMPWPLPHPFLSFRGPGKRPGSRPLDPQVGRHGGTARLLGRETVV